jgi:iron complex outermembrane receptor protein
MISIHRALMGGAGAFAAYLGLLAPAFADDTTQLAEVVVTAEKRVENVQTVPIAVTVVSGDAFTKSNTSGFADLAKFAPSLTMTTGDQPANNAIVVRGTTAARL